MQITRTTTLGVEPALTTAGLTSGGSRGHGAPPHTHTFQDAHAQAMGTFPPRDDAPFTAQPPATSTTSGAAAQADPHTLIIDGLQRHHLGRAVLPTGVGTLRVVERLEPTREQGLDLQF